MFCNKIAQNKGFTLVELLMVISIISLLSTIVLASLNSAREKGQVAAGKQFDGHTYRAFGADSLLTYNFDDGTGLSVTDSSGNGLDGVLVNSSGWTTGIKGSAMNFAANILTVTSSNTIIQNNSADGSISLWVNFNSTPTTNYVLSTGISSLPSTANGLVIRGASNSGNFVSVLQNGVQILEGNKSPSTYTGKWAHIFVTWSGTWGGVNGNVRLYINGEQVSTADNFNPILIWNYSNQFTIGGWGTTYSNALIDELRIYNKSLQTAEIEKLYAEGLLTHAVAVTE